MRVSKTTLAPVGAAPAPAVVAVDVGGSSVRAAVSRAPGEIGDVQSRPLAHLRGSPSAVDAVVALSVDAVAAARIAGAAPRAVGLAIPGIVDPAAGVGVSSMILGWHQVPFAALVAAATGLPVALGHDVRLAARAEGCWGAGAGHRDWLFVTLGTGVGAAFVLGGEVYTGAHGLGGELAHVVVEPGGPLCRCGKRGCLEMVSSADAVTHGYTASAGADVADASEVVTLAAAGDLLARTVWNRAIAGLARALTSYTEMLDPEAIIVGGGMSAAGDALFSPLGRALREGVSFAVAPTLRPAGLGAMAGVHGAALAAREVLFTTGAKAGSSA